MVMKKFVISVIDIFKSENIKSHSPLYFPSLHILLIIHII